MRTTLDIADDVLQAAKERAGVKPFARRGGSVTNRLIDKLRGEDTY
jgi:hypothetical protein